ncbi:MAG: DinB family protein [Planctomycetes bacterium]|nr:DinB family protein [Planctomycetota bacterium]
MGRIADGFLLGYEREYETTLRVLRGAPACELRFRPHPRSMSLGQLALHIAEMERWVVDAVAAGGVEVGGGGPPLPEPSTTDEIFAKLEEGHDERMAAIRGWSDERLLAQIAMTGPQGEVFLALPAIAFLEVVLLHHTIHHRGQLTVYIRLVGHKVPSIYGPSADDPGPMAGRSPS